MSIRFCRGRSVRRRAGSRAGRVATCARGDAWRLVRAFVLASTIERAVALEIGFGFAVACGGVGGGLSACSPNTDLLAEQGGSSTAGAGQASAMASVVALVDPVSGAIDVPLNLAAVTLRFPGAVTVPAGALAITGAGAAVAVGIPAVVDCPQAGAGAGTCVAIGLAEVLMPAATYVVAIGNGVTDDAGRATPPGPVGRFITASQIDSIAPAIVGLTVEPSGPCVLVGFQTDEPATAAVVIRSSDIERVVAAGAGAAAFQVATSIAPFGAGADLEIVARAHDLAGNTSESAAVALTVPASLVPLAITEVHANPAGAEPVQEFVEIRNLGAAAIDLSGIFVEDAKGSDALPAASLDVGAYGLIVASGFDPASPVDTAPLAGTPLFRVDTRIGADGLANTGEIVRLRAGDGTIVSSYSAAIDVSASKWSGKSVHRLPEDACDQSASWSHLPEAATPGWGAP